MASLLASRRFADCPGVSWHAQTVLRDYWLLCASEIGQESPQREQIALPHYQLLCESQISQEFSGRVLLSSPLYLLFGDFQLALESPVHGLLALLVCLSPYDAPSAHQSAFASSEKPV